MVCYTKVEASPGLLSAPHIFSSCDVIILSKFHEATEEVKKSGELGKEIPEAIQNTEFYRNKMQEIILHNSRCDTRFKEL
ncbi:hypothetical protein L1887_33855 [Cichorium endivia]|nr:hypothetical protein L1887_33855 [Cichorium endivia]